jgi:hypothetical protein
MGMFSNFQPLSFKVQNAHASCVQDTDWPDRDCLDMPPYSEEYLKQYWQQYYEYKGKEWMEVKKAEMDEAITNGMLRAWVETQNSPDNFANHNVWSYYYVNGQAPDAYAESEARNPDGSTQDAGGNWRWFRVNYENQTYNIAHLASGALINNITAESHSREITVTLLSELDGEVQLAIPKSLLNATQIWYDERGRVPGIFIDEIDSEDYASELRKDDIVFTIPFQAGTEEILIVGSGIPEFGSFVTIVLIVALGAALFIARRGFQPRIM